MKVNSSYVMAGKHIHSLLIALAVLVCVMIPWVLRPLQSTWLWIAWMGVWAASLVDQMIQFDPSDPHTGGYVFRRSVGLGLWTIAVCAVEVTIWAA